MIEVPAVVRNTARAAGAGDWLERLPALVSSLEAGWSITVGHPYEGGSEAFAADATRADGTPAVLKVLIPGTENNAFNEATVLRLVGGDGCPVLYRYDPDLGALLMERLGRPMFELGLPLARRLEILCATAARIWRRRGQAHRDERSVLVHGDVRQLNALQDDGGFKLIDPVGLLAEAEYDLGVLMRGDPVELLGGDPSTGPAGWPPARGSISSPYGSGAWSSGCRPDCSVPASTCSPSAATRWRRPRPSPA